MAELPRFSLFSELKRRSVFKVAVVYVAAGYGVLQGVDLAVGPLHLPSWTMVLLWVLVLAGFPIAMVLAWAFELTPEGVRRAEPLPTAVRPTRPLLALGFTLGILVAPTPWRAGRARTRAPMALPTETGRRSIPWPAAVSRRSWWPWLPSRTGRAMHRSRRWARWRQTGSPED